MLLVQSKLIFLPQLIFARLLHVFSQNIKLTLSI
jgi:hypothetical protein